MDFLREWYQYQEIPHLTFDFSPVSTREETITGKPMNFTPEAEYEVIRDSVSQKIDIFLVNTSNNFSRDSTQYKTPTPPLKIGDSFIYKNEGHNVMVELMDINKNFFCPMAMGPGVRC